MRRFRVRTVYAVAVSAMAMFAGAHVFTHQDRDDATEALKDAIDGGRAQNVILFLGDGMGDLDFAKRDPDYRGR